MPPERGDRIELVRTTDPHTDLKPGDKGTVDFVDSMATVHVQWDRGNRLGLIPGEDHWKVLASTQEG